MAEVAPTEAPPEMTEEQKAAEQAEKLARITQHVESFIAAAKKRAERFGSDYEEPKLEFILNPEELRLYMAPGAPGNPNGTLPMPAEAVEMEVEREIRDRAYVERIFEKVKDEYAKAKIRCEKFGTPFTAPRLDVILTRVEYRKYMSATAGRNPLDSDFAPVPGIDTVSEEEKAKQAARAAKFQKQQAEVTGVAAAAGEEMPEEDETGLSQDELMKRMQARASKYGMKIEYSPYGEDLKANFICTRRELEEEPDWLKDTLHVYGVDRLSTAEIMEYFNDYSPSFVLWLDDSSGNVVFSDTNNARRALYNHCMQIRLPPPMKPAPEVAQGEEPAAPEPDLEAPAAFDEVWRRGPDYTKSGRKYPVLVRYATTEDRKNGPPKPSKRLWLKGNKPQGGLKGHGGGAGGRGYGGGAYGGGNYRQDRYEGGDQYQQAGPVADLRGSIGKMRKEKKSRTARQRGSHPYAMQLDESYSSEPAMMDPEAADMIIEEGNQAKELNEEEQGVLDQAVVSSAPISSWADEME